MLSNIETLAVGAMGGLATYLLARRQFVSERAWEKRYELYVELFTILSGITHSARLLEAALLGGPTQRDSPACRDAAMAYTSSVLSLHQVQGRLMLLGAKEAHMKVMVLYSALHSLDPIAICVGCLEEKDISELEENLTFSRREASGRSGELALLARRELGLVPPWQRFLGPLLRSLRSIWYRLRH